MSSVDSKKLDGDLLMNLRVTCLDKENRGFYEKKENEVSNLKNKEIKKNEEFLKIKERNEFLENEVENKTLIYEAKVRECMEKIAR